MIMCRPHRSIHFIGIGGIGMSGLAELLISFGFSVTGSDRQRSPITSRLESLGARIQYDHAPVWVKNADIAVYSSAIKRENPEWTYARDSGIRLMRRAEMLGDLMRMKFSVGVSGTHGKTTTTSLIGQILHEAGMAPTIIVGGILKHSGSNLLRGSGDVLVAEADEYDRSFLEMYPSIAVVTTIEADHLDCYADIDDIKDTFIRYMNRVPFYGSVVACIDEPNVREALPRCTKPIVTYGLDPAADYSARDAAFERDRTSFVLYRGSERLVRLSVALPGMHNVKNACAACAVALEMGVEMKSIEAGLSGFWGVGRRFDIKGVRNGITIIDDYAHHPSEIRATLSAARSSGFKRIIAVFQPHLFSRTRDFLDGFVSSLSEADEVIVTGIYKSREEPIPGVSASAIVDKIKARGHGHARYIENAGSIAEELPATLRQGDAVVVMGAGDIGGLCEALLARMSDA
jgi:UDP-N-acetylmuramate--alanine ligase